jgi:hypothetical protein
VLHTTEYGEVPPDGVTVDAPVHTPKHCAATVEVEAESTGGFEIVNVDV